MKYLNKILFLVVLFSLAGLFVAIFSGCVVAKVKKTYPDGTSVEGSLMQTMWQRKGLELDYATNTLHLKVDDSGAQANPIQDATALINAAKGQ
jgi:hypothetical protein